MNGDWQIDRAASPVLKLAAALLVLGALAAAQTAAGESAADTWAEALAVIATIPYEWRGDALGALAAAQAAAGEFAAARATADTMPERAEVREQVLIALVWAQAAAGQFAAR